MKFKKFKYTFYYGFSGFIFGCFFPIIATFIESKELGLSFWELHQSNPLFWIIDFAPFVLSFVASLIGLKQDFTEKLVKKRTNRLNDAYVELEEIFNANADAMRVVSTDFKLIRANKRFLDQFNVTKNKIIGKDCFISCPNHEEHGGATCKTDDCILKRIIEGEDRFDFESIYTTDKGEKKNLLITASRYNNRIGEIAGMIESIKDITELKEDQLVKSKMQEEMFQTSKLASIGTLASGVAHELNNPLTGIIGFSEILKRKPNDVERVLDIAHKILHASIRMKSIVNHLRKFSRKSSQHDWKAINIDEPINNSIILLRDRLRLASVELDLQLGVSLPPIWGDENLLESVFQNFMTNSRDAFEDNQVEFEKRKIIFQTQKVEGGIQIHYSDTAGGMREEVKRKLFDAFFTTKGAERGTGIGMSIAKDIIDKHEGFVEVESTLGDGTTFIIFFPEDRRNESRPDNKNEEIKKIITKEVDVINSEKKKLLLVDDEESILEVLSDFLEDDFDVITNGGSKDVLELIENNNFDIIVTDFNMPDISGMELLFKAKSMEQEVPVVMMSGMDREDPAIVDALKKGTKEFIMKPFDDIDEVIEIIKNYSK